MKKPTAIVKKAAALIMAAAVIFTTAVIAPNGGFPALTAEAAYSSGSRGADVRVMQCKLISLGFLANGQNDGIYGPKTAAAVAAFQRGYSLPATGTADDATLARINEAYNTLIGSAASSPEYNSGQSLTVTGSCVNIRTYAGTGYARIGSVYCGARYAVLGSARASNGVLWYKIQYGSSQGYIVSSYVSVSAGSIQPPSVTAPTGNTVTITGSPVNIRTGPGTNYAKLGSVTSGAMFTLLGTAQASNGVLWYKIQYGSSQAYVISTLSRASYGSAQTPSTPAPPASNPGYLSYYFVVTGSAVNIRTGPGTNYSRIATLPYGAQYGISDYAVASNGVGWYKFQYAAGYAWIVSTYVKVSTLTVTTTTAPTTAPTTAATTAPTTVTTAPTTAPTTAAPAIPSYISRSITVSVPAAAVYSAPGTSNAVLGYVYQGQVYTATAWDNDAADITWFKFTLGAQEVWISRKDVTISDSFTTIPDRNFSDGHTAVIYLSPSRQTANPYSAGGTNECVQMESVAYQLKQKLESQYNCVVYIPDRATPISATGRPLDAYLKGADVYLAIHSNAASGSSFGAESYCFPASAQSMALGQNIVNEMRAISPFAPTSDSPVKNGMSYFWNIGYGEVRDPSNYGMAAVLAEVEYHDNASSAQWIINNTGAIADALCRALANTFALTAKTA